MVEFAKANGGVHLMLDDLETSIIRGLVGELRELILDEDEANDPVIGRLFPSAYEDPTEQSSYQDLVGDDLSRHKMEALDVVSSALDSKGTEVTLDEESLDAWLSCLTDMRLAIGTRLEVDEEQMTADIDPSHPNARALAVLHWLGGIQEGILRTVESQRASVNPGGSRSSRTLGTPPRRRRQWFRGSPSPRTSPGSAGSGWPS